MDGFDREAFRAAAAQAAAPQLVGVDMPGIGHCWVRARSFGDEMAAVAARDAIKASGVDLSRDLLAAVHLAQNLCGPQGEPIFDPCNLDDLKTLAALPLDAVGDALLKAGQVGGGKTTPKA